MSGEPPQPVLTIDEVADWLGMHRNSVHRAARQGRLPARRVGKEWRFLRDAVAARWTPGRRLRGPAEAAPLGPDFPESPVELSATEAAEFLRVEPNTIYHEAAADRLPAWKEGQEWRTSASALREYLSSDPDPSGRYVRNGGLEKQARCGEASPAAAAGLLRALPGEGRRADARDPRCAG